MSSKETEKQYGSGGHRKMSLNTVNRYRGRGQYDYQQIYPIIDQAPILHVAFSSSPDHDNDPFPTFRHGGWLCLSRQGDGNESLDAKGIPVCVSATIMDGIVLALTPNHHSCNYRSAVAFGHAHVVEDEAERIYAMELITNNLVPERWQHTRYPNKTELKSTGILRVDIHSASAKVRTGTTGEAREDLKDEGMRKDVWAGVVPTRMVYEKPIAAPTNLFPGVPEYISDWIEEHDRTTARYVSEVSH
ncbi:hypothetical protein E4T51_04922 [Aureobasidium sp. EXF-12344]|nr:hypothetical protein E4T51_04922 [Aureobasidium sp. EXF-12344]